MIESENVNGFVLENCTTKQCNF